MIFFSTSPSHTFVLPRDRLPVWKIIIIISVWEERKARKKKLTYMRCREAFFPFQCAKSENEWMKVVKLPNVPLRMRLKVHDCSWMMNWMCWRCFCAKKVRLWLASWLFRFRSFKEFWIVNMSEWHLAWNLGIIILKFWRWGSIWIFNLISVLKKFSLNALK